MKSFNHLLFKSFGRIQTYYLTNEKLKTIILVQNVKCNRLQGNIKKQKIKKILFIPINFNFYT